MATVTEGLAPEDKDNQIMLTSFFFQITSSTSVLTEQSVCYVCVYFWDHPPWNTGAPSHTAPPAVGTSTLKAHPRKAPTSLFGSYLK